MDERVKKNYKFKDFNITVTAPLYASKMPTHAGKQWVKHHFRISKKLTDKQNELMEKKPLAIMTLTDDVLIDFDDFYIENGKKGNLEVSISKSMPLHKIKELMTELEELEEYILDNYDEMIQFDYYYDMKEREVKEITEEIREKIREQNY